MQLCWAQPLGRSFILGDQADPLFWDQTCAGEVASMSKEFHSVKPENRNQLLHWLCQLLYSVFSRANGIPLHTKDPTSDTEDHTFSRVGCSNLCNSYVERALFLCWQCSVTCSRLKFSISSPTRGSATHFLKCFFEQCLDALLMRIIRLQIFLNR